MKGHVRERGAGNWYAVIDIRDPATGKRKRKWHSLEAKGKREAQIECAQLISGMRDGTYLEPQKTTLAQFLGQWLAHIKSQVSPRSHERYEEIATKNIVPLLGHALITTLKPAQISAAYSAALTSGRRDGKGGLAPRTVTHMHRVLKQALKQAVEWGTLNRNPADAVKPPKVEHQPMNIYDMTQTAALVDATRDSRLFIPTLLAVFCGLRRGEIAALRWRNVNLSAGQLAVVESVEQMNKSVRLKETKSGRSRTVALPAVVVEELRVHRMCQAQDLLKLGVRLADETFVATREDGAPMTPVFISHEWVRLILKTDLPRIRFHDLRHTHATHLLTSGVHPKIASERLGHSKIGITLDLYSHVMPGMQEDAVAKVDAAFTAAKNRR